MFEKLHAFFSAFFVRNDDARETLVEALETAPVGSMEALKAELSLTQYDLAHAKDKAIKRLTVKEIRLSDKGGLNIMGLRRFPINLYVAELEAIVTAVEDGTVLRFLEAHRNQLSLAKPPTES